MPKRREGPTRSKSTGYYYFDNFIGFPPNKRRVRFSLRTRDPAKAQWLWEQEYKKRWSEYYGLQPPKKPEVIKFYDLCKEFIDYERDIKRIKEWKHFKDRLQIILDLWGNINIKLIGQEHFIRLDAWLKTNDRSNNTINHYFSLLKTLFNYAIRKKKYLGENPVSEVKPYVIDEKRRAYSAREITKIIEAAEKTENKARNNATLQKYAKRIILLLLFTGMRMGEILNLRWDNIREDRIVLKRTETKQKKDKVIPLTDGIKNVLESIHNGRGQDGFVIPLRRRGGKMKAGYADSLIRKIREYSGIDDFILHNLRHTASTIMVSEALGKGVGLADIMRILGHSEIKTTMKYMHSDFGQMKKAMAALEEKAKK